MKMHIHGQLRKYFDLMASIVRRVLDKHEFSEKDFRSVFENQNGEPYSVLKRRFPQLMNDNCTYKEIEITDLTDAFLIGVQSLASGWNNLYYDVILLYYMDRAIERCYKRNRTFKSEVEEYTALNFNSKETGILIIEKVKCKWEHTQIRNSFEAVLKNFYYVDCYALKNTITVNYVFDSSLAFEDKSSLKLAISPVTKEKTVEFSAPYERKNEKTNAGQKLFRVERVVNEDHITEKVLNNILKAGEDQVDVLVFPEMLGTQCMLDKIKKSLDGKEQEIPLLIVFPSIWEKTDNDEMNQNQSSVFLQGEELFKQKKYADFKYFSNGAFVYEDINRKRNEEKVIHILHIEDLGRICVIICYDYLEEENREGIVKNFHPTLICSPSFSTGSFDFRILSQHNFSRNCNWIWCNTCSALHTADEKKKKNFDIIGLITKLSKNCDLSAEGTFQEVYDGITKCQKNSCDNCIYCTEIPLNILENEVTK